MRLAWLTDIHLNFLDDEAEIDRFLDNVREDGPDVVLLSGDIGEAYSVIGYLEHIQQHLQRPIYFVLGNHDYYRGSVRTVRAAVADFADEAQWLTWLPAAGVVELTLDVALIGHGAWADGRCGDYDNSSILLNDYLLIEEFAGLAPRARLDRLHALGDEAAAYFRQTLTQAVAHYKRVILVTHIPPFETACWHEGQISDDNFLPHFVCQAAGMALLDVMNAHPDSELLVLCGHTHGEGQVQVADNIHVLTGGAEYGLPEVQRVFDLVEPPSVSDIAEEEAATAASDAPDVPSAAS
ncbi:metallophosphoesterase family protein [Chloroflexota bacterium]